MDIFSRLAAMAALLGTAVTLQAQDNWIYVDASAPVGGDGNSFETAYRYLGEACEAATRIAQETEKTGGATVRLMIAQGLYRPSADSVGKMNAFEINGKYPTPLSAVALASAFSVHIFGGFAGRNAADPYLRDPAAYVSVLTADVNGDDSPGFVNRDDNAQTVLSVYTKGSNRVIVDGLTFTGGKVRPRPGAVESVSGGLYVSELDLSADSYVTVENCIFIENEGSQGGGIKMGTGRVWGCKFEQNRADEGGGLFGPNVWISETTFYQNHARRGGGYMGDGRLTRSEFRENIADEDGGACIRTSTAENAGYSGVEFVLFAGNAAARNGGAVFIERLSVSSDQLFVRCTFVGNSARSGGALQGPSLYPSACIFFANRASETGDQATVTGDQMQLDNCQIEATPRALTALSGARYGLINSVWGDPKFVSPQGSDHDAHTTSDNNYRLAEDSPCIDAMRLWGSSYYRVSDLDGLSANEPGPGASAATPDIGCFEWRQNCPADFDASGGTPDVTDLSAFLEAYAPRLPGADINGNGWVDQDDIQKFFEIWLAGGC